MKTIAELRLLPVWINPGHLVSTAKIILSGHKLNALGVVEDDRLIGLVTPEQIAAASPEAQVRSVMLPVDQTIQFDAPVRSVADLMVREDLAFVPVMRDKVFVGMLTATMLLKELGRTWDPLTGLSWSDRLREWGVERLKEGRDVTIVFIDLDDFGLYNKRLGHIVGDRVLQKVAAMLRECVDEARELLVRYGGDEFAIATVRDSSETERLINLLQERMAGLFVEEGDQPVTFSIGSFGGRRSKERENVHYAATLDSLINLASKDCMAKKASAKASHGAIAGSTPTAVAQVASIPATISVMEVNADDRSPGALITVSLSKDDSFAMGFQSRTGQPVIELVAQAAAKAAERAIQGVQVRVDEVRLSEHEGARTVSITGRLITEGRETPIGAVRRVEGDLYFAAADAVVEAVRTALSS